MVRCRFDAFNGREKALASSCCTCSHYHGTFLFGRASSRLGPTECLQSRKLFYSIRVSQFFSRESPTSLDGNVNLPLWPGVACVVALTGLIPLSPDRERAAWKFANAPGDPPPCRGKREILPIQSDSRSRRYRYWIGIGSALECLIRFR